MLTDNTTPPPITQTDIDASVVSSQIRVIRNIENYPLVSSLSIIQKEKLESEVINFIKKWGKEIYVLETNKLTNHEKETFFDNDFMFKNFLKNKQGKFIIFKDSNISILLNWNDHINIFIQNPALSIKDSYSIAEDIEDRIGRQFSYLASTKYGFLTSHIKNCGLAIKMSVLVHLPGISFLGKKEGLFKTLLERGYSITQWSYNKNNDNSTYFIVSSKLNFGVTEKQLIQRFTKGIENLIEMDQKALFEYYYKNKDYLVDTIFRSYGILKYAIQMEYSEALNHISNLRIGFKIGAKLPLTMDILNELFLQIKDGYADKLTDSENITNNIARANIIKSLLDQGR